ncbi:hypothetical protein [Actinomadura sp. 6N118]|uniref:hypothetical protein n=1 Tax=Actinomadura sp. 6N118 TaxID=3375151 RepID=UPI0037901247
MVARGEPEQAIRPTDSIKVFDPQGQPSELIIRRSDDFQVAMEFEILTPLLRAFLGSFSYQVKYFAEGFGPGPEYVLGVAGWLQTAPGQSIYNGTSPPNAKTLVQVNRNTLDVGVYRLAAMVTFRAGCPGQPTRPIPLTAFVEGTVIEIYN